MAGQELGHNASLELFTDIRRRLAKAVLLFQDKFVDLRVDSGSLVQVTCGLVELFVLCSVAALR